MQLHIKKRLAFISSFVLLFALALVLFGCKNKFIDERTKAIAKAEPFISDNVHFDTAEKSADAIYEGEKYVIASPDKKQAISKAIDTLKAVNDKQLKQADVDKLLNEIKDLTIIEGKAMKVTFALAGGTDTTKTLVFPHKKGTKLNAEQIPNPIKEGAKFQHWQVAEQKVEDILAYEINAHTTFTASYILVRKVQVAQDSIDHIVLDNKGGQIDFNQVPNNTVVNFTVQNIAEGKKVKDVKIGDISVKNFDHTTNKGDFLVNKDITISVRFSYIEYLLNLFGDGLMTTNGLLDGAVITRGTNITFKFPVDPNGKTPLLTIQDGEQTIYLIENDFTKKDNFYEYKYQSKFNVKGTLGYSELRKITFADEATKEYIKWTTPITDFNSIIDNTTVIFTIDKTKLPAGTASVNVLVNGNPISTTGDNYQLVVDGDKVIQITTIPFFYLVTYSGTGLSATIANNTEVNHGTNVIFTAEKQSGKIAKLTVNDEVVSLQEHTDNYTYELVITQNTTVELTYITDNNKYSVTFKDDHAQYFIYDAVTYPDLTQITAGDTFVFEIDETKIAIGFILEKVLANGAVVTKTASGKYQVAVYNNSVLEVVLKEQNHLLVYSGDGLTCSFATNSQVAHKQLVTLNVAGKPDTIFTLTANSEVVVLVADGSNWKYEFIMDKPYNFELTSSETRTIRVDVASQEYITFVDPTIDVTQVTAIKKGNSLLFKIHNLPEGKKIKALYINDEAIAFSTDLSFEYELIMTEHKVIKLELETITLPVNFVVAGTNVFDYIKIYREGDESNLITANEFVAYNTKLVFAAHNPVPASHSFTIIINDNPLAMDALPHIITVKEEQIIQITLELESATLSFEFTGSEKLFHRGLFGNDIADYATLMDQFSGETINQGHVLSYDDEKTFFLDQNDYAKVFDGFKIKGTDIIVRNADVVPLVSANVVLVPNYVKGLYRTDLLANIYYLYRVISPSEIELFEVGNILDNATQQPKPITPGRDLLILEREIIEDALHSTIIYDVVSIASGATKYLVNAEVIDIYRSNNSAVKFIGDDNFNNIANLKYLLLSDKIQRIGKNVLQNCPALQYEEYNGVRYLATKGGQDTKYLIAMAAADINATSITLHENTRIIFTNAFANMTKLTTVVLNSDLKQIAYQAFNECNLLADVNFDAPTSLCFIESGAFKATQITTAMFTAIKDKKCKIADDAI